MSEDETTAAAREADARYYADNYPDYEAQNPERKIGYYRRHVDAFFDKSCPKRLHDMGCAYAKFLKSLDPSWEIFGSDLNTYAIEQARQRVARGTFTVAGVTADSPFAAVTFGAVTAFDVLEHVPDLEAAARGIDAQLAPRGILVFVVPVYDGLTGPIVRLLDRDPTHVHKKPRRFWIDWAERHFQVVHWEGVLRYLLPGGFSYVHAPGRICRGHLPAILVACRKR